VGAEVNSKMFTLAPPVCGELKRSPHGFSVPAYLGVQVIRLAHELGHEGRRRLGIDAGGRSQLFQTAGAHDPHPVGDGERLLLVVGDEDERRPDLFLQRFQLDPQRPPDLRVERPERLVEQQHRGAQDERPGERKTLLVAEGKPARAPTRVFAELQDIDDPIDRTRRRPGQPFLDVEILPDRQVRVGRRRFDEVPDAGEHAGAVLRERGAEDRYLAVARPDEAQ